MLETIKQFLTVSDHPMLDAAILISIAAMIAIAISYTIKWGLLRWAHKQNKLSLSFIFEAIRFPITLSILFIGINNAANAFVLPSGVQHYLPTVLQTLDILVWGQFFYRSSLFSLKTTSQRNRTGSIINMQTLPLFENTAAVIIVLMIMYLIFITWNIDMSAWLASAGIIGIAVGFAAKDTIANLLSGIFILADSPYKIGDFIVIDSGERGMVTHIGLRSTRILTRDDLEVNVPNAIIANGKIINESSGRFVKSRIRIQVSVAYDVDIDHAKQTLLRVAEKDEHICQDPEPRIRFRRFGGSGLDLELLVWIDEPEHRGLIVDALNTAVYKEFAKEKIEIPYSKHDLYIKSLPEEGVKNPI